MSETVANDRNTELRALAEKALRGVGLPDTQIASVIDDVVKKTAFLKSIPKDDYWDFNSKIEQAVDLLGIPEKKAPPPKERYIEAALKQSSLFCQAPERINSNIEGAAKLLGILKECYVEAALKQPPLFYRAPERINSNIEGAAKLLGTSKEKYVEAALKQPSLFCQTPKRVNSNIEGAAKLLGISKEKYVEAALKQPQLFSQDPQTIYNHGRLMRLFNQRDLITPSVDDYFLNQPALLCLADNNFKLRLTYAYFSGRQSEKKYGLLRKTRKLTEQALVEVMGHDPETKTVRRADGSFKDNKKHHQLVRMIETGLIKGYKLEAEPA